MTAETLLQNYAQGITWDLSDLYKSPADPKLEADLMSAEAKALAFEKKYKPLFESRTNGHWPMAELLADYKEIMTLMTKPGVYAHLSFAEKTNDPAIGAFMQKIQVRLTDISSHLIFFEVQWNKLNAGTAALILKDPPLEPDRHFLEKMRAFAPYTLNEGEEKILAIKSNTSGAA